MSDTESPPRAADDPRLFLVMTVLLVVIFVTSTIDLVLDRPRTILDFHVLVEVTVALSCGGAAWLLGMGWVRARRSVRDLGRALDRHRTELEAWRSRAGALQEGLGRAIDEQLAKWDLTPTERETALYLLKGYSHKEIAAAKGGSDRTVRQHAAAVYKKSGLAGRAELSAFFLEGLLPSREASGRERAG